MARPFVTHIDLAKNELQNAVIQPLASAPSSPVEGQIYYNTTDDTIYVWANGAWLDLGVQGGSGATNLAATLSASNTIITSDTGTDATIPAVDGTNAGVMTPTMKTKLDGIEASADVTDATNVDAAGAVMNSDTSTTGMSFVVDEDNMASNSDTKIPTQQSVKAYIDASVVGLLDFKGATDASTNPNYPSALKGDTYVISVAGKVGGASGTSVEVGDMIVATADNAGGTQASVGTSWRVLEHNLVGAMLASNNLSDVANAATAYDNIKQAASTIYVGSVELATQAEAQAKTDTTRALTAASVADFARKVTGTIGNGSLTDLPVTHGLGTQWVTAQVYEVSTGALVECDVVVTSSTVVTFTFAVAPTTNQYRYVIVG
jgi:hypothetical protein